VAVALAERVAVLVGRRRRQQNFGGIGGLL
jgi:hypothetical protein